MKSEPGFEGEKKTRKKQLQMFGARSEHTVSRRCQPHDPRSLVKQKSIQDIWLGKCLRGRF